MTTGADTEKILELLRSEVKIDVPSTDHDLIESGLLDSLAFVELIYHIEQRYGLRIDIETIELDDLRTAERIARFVDSRQASGG